MVVLSIISYHNILYQLTRLRFRWNELNLVVLKYLGSISFEKRDTSAIENPVPELDHWTQQLSVSVLSASSMSYNLNTNCCGYMNQRRNIRCKTLNTNRWATKSQSVHAYIRPHTYNASSSSAWIVPRRSDGVIAAHYIVRDLYWSTWLQSPKWLWKHILYWNVLCFGQATFTCRLVLQRSWMNKGDWLISSFK